MQLGRVTGTSYEKGLHQVGDGAWAYLQPDGSWGWSNAGLIAGGGASLLVDTLFDLRLTAEMLDEMRRAVPAAASIGTVVNTHANGDHCYGNELVAGAEIISSTATAAEMAEVPPDVLAGLLAGAEALGPLGDFATMAFGAFEFEGITLTLPDRTFDGRLDLTVGDVAVTLLEVGPAHTRGDVIAHVPGAGVVFTGDILFNGGHPIAWEGPVSNWVAACDRILALDDADVVVPGHGPVTDRRAVDDLKGYFGHLTAEARRRFDDGVDPMDAAEDILRHGLGEYAELGEPERLAVNVTTLYRDFGGDPPSDILTLGAGMARLMQAH